MSKKGKGLDESGYLSVDLGKDLRDSFLGTCLEQGTTPFDAIRELAQEVVDGNGFPVTVDPRQDSMEDVEGEGQP